MEDVPIIRPTAVCWEKDQVIKLINAYRCKEILWDPANDNYYNKTLKACAWRELSQEMELPVDELKRKIDYLLGQLRRVKMKKRRMLEADPSKVYVSSWYAYEHLQFLNDRHKHRKRILELLQEFQMAFPPEEETEDDSIPPAVELIPITMKSESIIIDSDPETCLDEAIKSEASNASTSDYQPQPQKRRKETVDQEHYPENSVEICMPTPSTTQPNASVETASDISEESQLYANYLASKLRVYSKRARNRLQHEIGNLLFHADNGEFD